MVDTKLSSYATCTQPLTLLLVILLLVLSAADVVAQPPRPQTLFRFKDFDQAVTLSGEFTNESSNNSGSNLSLTRQRFTEEYEVGLTYAVLGPRLLRGRISASAALDQDETSGNQQRQTSTSGRNFTYGVNGVLLDRSPYPISFFSSSDISHSQVTFVPSYDIKSDAHGVTLALPNHYLPASLSYISTSSRTSGLNEESRQTGDNFSVAASHRFRQLSTTGAAISWASNDYTSGNRSNFSKTFNLSVENSLTFDKAGKNRLRSAYEIQDEIGTLQLYSTTWNESLLWEFGRGLQSGILFNQKRLSGENRDYTITSGSAFLRHTLFRSLATRLEAHAQETDYVAGGRITATGGVILLDYTKELPEQSKLHLSYSQGYSITDNKLLSNDLSVLDEKESVPNLDPFEFPLKNEDVNQTTIFVWSQNRLTQYKEGTDYTLRTEGRQTFIVVQNPPLPGATVPPILPGAVLSVDYHYQFNPSSRFTTSTRTAGGSLYLFASRHRIYARMSDSSYDSLSSGTGASHQNNTSTWLLGFDSKLPNNTFGASAQVTESDISNTKNLVGFWRYNRYFNVSSLGLSLRENLNFSSSNATGSTSSTNVITATAEYRRKFLRRVQMGLTGFYSRTNGRFDSDDVRGELNLGTRLGRLYASLATSVAFYFSGGNTTTSERVYLTLTRSF